MTSRRFEPPAKAIANLQRKVRELDRRASRIGHSHLSAARWHLSSPQTVPTNDATTVEYDDEVFQHDPQGDFTMGTGGSAGEITFNNPGVYGVLGGLTVAETFPNGSRSILRVDRSPGGPIAGQESTNAVSTGVFTTSVAALWEVDANDIVFITWFHNVSPGMDVGVSAQTFFAVYRLA